jgi:HEAT repeat protein
MSGDTNDSIRVTEAIEKLWSADDEQRRRGKSEILRLGVQSADGLVALLENLLRNPRLYFSKGNEQKGNEAIEGLQRIVRTVSNVRVAWEQSEEYRQIISKLAINSRLFFDIIELLGDLRSEKAVPVLIEIMVSQRSMNNPSTNPMYTEMEALCRIGNVAVPQLIEVLENANQRAEDASDYSPGFIIETDMPTHSDLSSQVSLQHAKAELEEEEDNTDISFEANGIRSRAAKVLGEIGDARALPALESALNSSDIRLARGVIADAIDMIKSR